MRAWVYFWSWTLWKKRSHGFWNWASSTFRLCFFLTLCQSHTNGRKKLNYLFICESSILNFSSQFYAGKWVKLWTDYYQRKGWKYWEKSPAWLNCIVYVQVLTCFHAASTTQLVYLSVIWLSSPWRKPQPCVWCVPLFLVNSETSNEEIVIYR